LKKATLASNKDLGAKFLAGETSLEEFENMILK